MASLVVILIVLGCAALQFFKGTLVRAVVAVIIAIIAGMISFAFFEGAANMIISRADGGSMLALAPWAQTLCFLLIFIVVFALLQTGALYLLRDKVEFGELPEGIGRAVCGLLLGYLISGFLLVALAMGPLSLDYPYPRFDSRNLKPDNPKGVLPYPDGFATGLFSMISKGSFSGKRSFATIHPNYLDQLFFNRLIKTASISIISSEFPAIMVPRQAVWDAPKTIADPATVLIGELKSRGKIRNVSLPVSTVSGDIKIVRVGVLTKALRGDARINGGAFTPSQLRLICKRRGSSQDRLAGEAINIYPLGYLKAADQIQVSPEIRITSTGAGGSEQLIDFVFNVPSGHEPVLVQYKMNTMVEIPRSAIVDDSSTYEAVTFNASSGGGGGRNQGNQNRNRPSDPAQGQSPADGSSGRRSGLSDTSRSIVGPDFDEE